MSLDLKLAIVYFGIVVFAGLILSGRYLIRRAIDGPITHAEHAFYVTATGHDPVCSDCPMNKRCPYSNGRTCKFSVKR